MNTVKLRWLAEEIRYAKESNCKRHQNEVYGMVRAMYIADVINKRAYDKLTDYILAWGVYR